MVALLAFSMTAILAAQQLSPSAHITAAILDSDSHLIVAGVAYGPDLPTTAGTIQPAWPSTCVSNTALAECTHGFVAKIAPTANQVLWATYFGGNGADSIGALALAPDGSVFIAGTTSSKDLFAGLTGYQSRPAAIFVARIAADGDSILAGTYFGSDDQLGAMLLDAAGNVYISGDAYSNPFPTTPSAYRQTYSPSACGVSPDQFVAKLDPSLTTLMLSTLLGTPGGVVPSVVELGADGTIYVAGTSGYERAGPCPARPTLTRLAPDARSAIFSVQIDPGAVPLGGYVLAVDAAGNAYLEGDTWNSPPPWHGVIWKVAPNGTLAESQPIDGSIDRLLVDPSGEVVAVGTASPSDLAITPGAVASCDGIPAAQASEVSPEDFYVARLNSPDLSYSYAGFLNSATALLIGPDLVLTFNPYTTTLTWALIPAGPPPSGTVTCVANAANFEGFGPLVPGESVALFGRDIGPEDPVSAQFDQDGNLTGDLGGISVSFDGVMAPLLFAGPDQIDAIVPFESPTAGQIHTEIRRDGAVVSAFDKTAGLTNVGIFRNFASGLSPLTSSFPLAAINQDGSVNGPDNPSPSGSVVTLYSTGFGPLANEAVDRTHPRLRSSYPVVPISVTVDGQPATIEFIGNAPTPVQGVFQLSIRLPGSLPSETSGSADISVTAGKPHNQSADGGAIWIR